PRCSVPLADAPRPRCGPSASSTGPTADRYTTARSNPAPIATSTATAIPRRRVMRRNLGPWYVRSRGCFRTENFEHDDRGLLVEVLVPVPALGRLHARRASVVARAAKHQLVRGAQQRVHGRVGELGDAG